MQIVKITVGDDTVLELKTKLSRKDRRAIENELQQSAFTLMGQISESGFNLQDMRNAQRDGKTLELESGDTLTPSAEVDDEDKDLVMIDDEVDAIALRVVTKIDGVDGADPLLLDEDAYAQLSAYIIENYEKPDVSESAPNSRAISPPAS